MCDATFDFKLSKVRHVAVCDVWVHCGLLHTLMKIFGSSPPKTIILVNKIGFELELCCPTIVVFTFVTEGALIGLLSPRVADPNQLRPIAELLGTVDGKGMHVGDTNIILLLV